VEIFGLPASVLAQGSVTTLVTTLLAGCVWLILTGRLVPRSAVEDLRADRDYWREALATCQATNGEKLDQNTAVLTELTSTTDRFFDSLPAPAGRRTQRGRT
jgi:hypothetical protein